MNKIIDFILPIASTAWNGALVVICFFVYGEAFFRLTDKFFCNNIIASCALCTVLVGGTLWAGAIAKEKRAKRKGRDIYE